MTDRGHKWQITWRLRQGSMAWSWRWPCWSPSPCRKTRNSSEKHRFRLHLGSCLTKESGKTEPFARRFHLAKNLFFLPHKQPAKHCNRVTLWFHIVPFCIFLLNTGENLWHKITKHKSVAPSAIFPSSFLFPPGPSPASLPVIHYIHKAKPRAKCVQNCPNVSARIHLLSPVSPGPHFLSSVCQSSAWKGARATPRHHQLPSGSHPA